MQVRFIRATATASTEMLFAITALKLILAQAILPSGIYFDDPFSDQTAYGNVLINIPGYAFLIGGGRG